VGDAAFQYWKIKEWEDSNFPDNLLWEIWCMRPHKIEVQDIRAKSIYVRHLIVSTLSAIEEIAPPDLTVTRAFAEVLICKVSNLTTQACDRLYV